MGWSLSAAARGGGPGAFMLVVGAILVIVSAACFRGAALLRFFGAKDVGEGACWTFGVLGVGLIIAAVAYFFRRR